MGIRGDQGVYFASTEEGKRGGADGRLPPPEKSYFTVSGVEAGLSSSVDSGPGSGSGSGSSGSGG